ncbi:hypothetical protein ScPMuIL_000960 [Solemya velum]
MWTYLLVVCAVVFLTDARECDDTVLFFKEYGICLRATDFSEVLNELAVLYNDDSLSQSDLRIVTSALCSWTIPLRSCMSAMLEDCSNYATEMEPLLSGDNMMCNSNGSASGELQTMVNEFSRFDNNKDCSSATTKVFSRCDLPETPPELVMVKDIAKYFEQSVHGKISCIAEELQDTDVSACGRKSDVLAVAIVREYVSSGGLLSVPFDYSDYVTADGGEREKKDILGTILGF